MKTYSLNHFGVIGGRENNSHIYIKNLDLDTDHFDEKLHSHPDSDEYYVILEGKIRFEKTSSEIEIGTGEVICFYQDELHRIKQVLVPTKVMIIKTTNSVRNLE